MEYQQLLQTQSWAEVEVEMGIEQEKQAVCYLWFSCDNDQDLSSGYNNLDLLLVHRGAYSWELWEKSDDGEWWVEW